MTDEPQKQKNAMDWLRESATVKAIFIAILILVLLIPSGLVQDLINERAARQEETIAEVSDAWSGRQLIKGPVLVIPYKKTETFLDTSRKEVSREVVDHIYVLPDNLSYKASITSEVRHRGIFDVAVYNSKINVNGNFASLNLAALNIRPEQLLPERARLTFEISDLKGLKKDPVIKAAGQVLTAEPSLSNTSIFKNGLQAAINLVSNGGNAFNFSYELDIKGSNDLHFLHLGKVTDVQANGDWPSPSFEGRTIPDTSKVNGAGFAAKWHMLYLNRPFPQQWTTDYNLLDNVKGLQQATFGVKLHMPVDDYQKTTRTSKYAILIILLTFVSLFITEIVGKQRVHVFNYVLIGAAMIIYYTLLLSFSEQIGFNMAYLVASLSTVALIAAFIASLLKKGKAAILFSFILSLFYTFIFVIIQLEDLALMVGSIALFIIVAVLMYISRKINWDNN
ncbi:cell envelope integrity protein CreD [Mucilaginibacter hurinus]|uniref:Cell envelope integrity protein CreD n=1 Tax=Mucilaginibacter hurinus TaxID=2201324 RepID=A0A367GS17_9SPHI|nr:cell envelope integrity protein CreD [Mucilaginibacter hurinus]RCH55541.1 cell envelope integrity protein CreD [Mucilaginibacter hurinus]